MWSLLTNSQRIQPHCAGCRKSITGTYITALDQNWHPEHFRCDYCKQPFNGRPFYTRNNKPYCETHYHELFSPRCTICQLPIRNSYITNLWDEFYCAEHQGKLPQCYSCKRLISQPSTGGGGRYKDGRTICNGCRHAAIKDQNTASQLLTQVQRELARLKFETRTGAYPIRLVSQTELSRLSQHAYAEKPAGMARSTILSVNGKVTSREIQEILVLYGLPPTHTAAIIAHELGHVWLLFNKFPRLPPLVEEGICEYFSYLWLNRQKGAEAMFHLAALESNIDPIYGMGYRSAQRAAAKQSFHKVLSYVCVNRQFPG